jgi:adenosylcobinamide-phosphate synthase
MAAFILDWVIGDPQGWPHPVRLIGRLAALMEKAARLAMARLSLTPPKVRLAGAVMAVIVVSATGLSAWGLLGWAGRASALIWYLLCLYLAYAAICLKDLLNHARSVERALAGADLDEARRRLSWIVGRDTGALDKEGVRRAVVETLAENFSDGLVAPLMYMALGGPVLAWMYKAVNTLDSMVGYKNDDYLNLGMFSAKLDDAANFIPARFAALLLVAASFLGRYNWKGALRGWRAEGRFHTSPNSGQTEAAMAGALGVWLGGPSRYGGLAIEKPVLGRGGEDATAASVRSAEKILILGTVLMVALAALAQLALTPWGWGVSF